jgi:hypothetical protein
MREIKSTCKLCKATGSIFIEEEGSTGEYRLIDKVRHKHTCAKTTQKAVQPAHLRKKKWREQERRAAKAINGYETPLSGALNEDGDARRMKGWRVECKRTTTDRYRLTQAVWTKLVTGAVESGERPAMFIDVAEGDKRFVLIVSEAPTVSRRAVKSVSIREDRTKYGDTILLLPPAKVLTEREFKQIVREEEQDENERDFRAGAAREVATE